LERDVRCRECGCKGESREEEGSVDRMVELVGEMAER